MEIISNNYKFTKDIVGDREGSGTGFFILAI